jgi:hypothetical protein
MPPKVDVAHSPTEPERWSVLLDDAEIVAFAGPRARQLAEQSRSDLVEFLDGASDMADVRVGDQSGRSPSSSRTRDA